MLEEINGAIEGLTSKAAGGEKKGKPEIRWTLFTAVGSFLLYLFGYLSLRFHLSAFGVATDLSVLDERYLFAGAQFLVYFVTSIPIVLLFVLPIFLILRRRIRSFVRGWVGSAPRRAVIIGILISIALIQFVIRKCLPFTNLLLRDRLPGDGWMQAILLDEGGAIQSLYFAGLVGAVLALAALLWIAHRQVTRPSLFWSGLLALLIAIQFLMLPVTFGILIGDQDTPRVTTLDGKEPLKAYEEAWRIWEGKDSTTFFVRRWQKGTAERRLVTLDNKKIERTEIVGYDRVLKLLF